MDTGIPPLFACMTSSRVVTVPAWPTFWQRTPSFIFLDEYASSQTHLFLPFLTGALAFAGAFFGAVFVCLPAGADTAGASFLLGDDATTPPKNDSSLENHK
jgi:hypothetical protein